MSENNKIKNFHFGDSKIKIGDKSINISGKGKLIIAWSIFIIASLIFVLVYTINNKKENKVVTEPDTSTETITESGIENEIPLEKDAYPAINEFVNKYLNSIANNDIETLKTLVTDPEEFSNDKYIREISGYVDYYTNIECYTKPGPIDNSYVVYAIVDAKLAGVETLGPDFHNFYLITDESGALLRNNSTNNEAVITNYLNRVASDEDVLQLSDTFSSKYQQALENNEDLKQFYDQMNSN